MYVHVYLVSVASNLPDDLLVSSESTSVANTKSLSVLSFTVLSEVSSRSPGVSSRSWPSDTTVTEVPRKHHGNKK